MEYPKETGLIVLENLPLDEVARLIDWKMYLVTWDFRTAETRESQEAKDLLKDSRELLDRIVAEHLLTIDGAVSILPAETRNHDDIVLFEDESRTEVYKFLPMLRRQIPRKGFCPSLADFITPQGEKAQESGIDDYMGVFAVTAGKKVDKTLTLFDENDLYSPLLLKSLADRLAEAGAEYIHSLVRRQYWGYEEGESFTTEELLREKYRGIRPAPGYPCCPDHTGKRDIFDILKAEETIGIELTESYMMQPAASVCGYIFASEKSEYFPVGPIGQDQLESYCERKEKPLKEIKKWLSVNLND